MPWLIALGPICALAQEEPVDAVVDDRSEPPFSSPEACLEFAQGASAGQPPQPAATMICDRIDQVWQNPSGAKPAADNPLRIDFGAPRFGADGYPAQATVDGALLARILTVPELLPPRLDGGLVLENLIVTGTLELTDAMIDLPVVLRHARFRPADTMMLADHLAPIAIRLDRAHFAAAFEIRESDVAGHLLIDHSVFARGLTLAEVVVSSRAGLSHPRAEGHLGRSAALHVRHSTFGADLSLVNVAIFNPPVRMDWGDSAGHSAEFEDVTVSPRFEMQDLYAEGNLEIARSELGTVSLQDFQIAGEFLLESNRLTRMKIADGNFYARTYINQNRVLQDVAIDRIGIYPQSADSIPIFRANQIGGSFMWAPSFVNGRISRIDLTYNRVDGLASVFPPDGSTAEIDLSNVEMPTKLELGRSYWYLDECGRRALYNSEEIADDSCPAKDDEPERLINLTNASIDILSWNFPLRSNVRWDGVGLRYAYWGDPDLKGGANPLRTDEHFIESLKAWRFAMQEPNSEAFDFMGSYLHSRGRFSDSRDLQEAAKEVNYRPKNLADLGGWVVYGLLLPTGFGVKPELALFWLFVGWLIGGAVYYLYRRWSQGAAWPPPTEPRLAGQRVLQEETSGFRHPAQAEGSSIIAELAEQPSLVPGFMQYQRDRRPADFSIWAFSADAMLPVINLHAYTEYYPSNQAIRLFSFLQHIVGWWMLSIFLASATIL
jgi:hypothetical protein